jgi:hypothetical protein
MVKQIMVGLAGLAALIALVVPATAGASTGPTGTPHACADPWPVWDVNDLAIYGSRKCATARAVAASVKRRQQYRIVAPRGWKCTQRITANGGTGPVAGDMVVWCWRGHTTVEWFYTWAD